MTSKAESARWGWQRSWLRHLERGLGRQWWDLRTALTVAAASRWHSWWGRGDEAVRCQAWLIRYVQRQRESLDAYDRLHRLIECYGDGGLGLRVEASRPEGCLFFLGYSRSGHSLVGSLLDAHPRIAIAHEQHALKHLAAGASFARIVRALQYNAQIFQRLGRHYTGYDYQVPGQFQGNLWESTFIGDKKGNGTARLLRQRPWIVERLGRALPVPFHFVHVVRNPYDNIATKALRTGRSLEEAARLYLANAELVEALKKRFPTQVVDVHLEDLIARPMPALRELLRHFALHADPSYLEACAAVLFREPSRTRERVQWPRGLILKVERHLARYPFLAPYGRGTGNSR